MFGFLMGTLCLIGFVSVYKRGRHGGFVWTRPWWLFRKLDTSPAQERVIRSAMASVRNDAKRFAEESKSSRSELGEVLRAPDFDAERVREWFATRELELGRVRETLVGALGEVHEVLDDQQRDKLARLIERGLWSRPFNRGPYRSHSPEAP